MKVMSIRESFLKYLELKLLQSSFVCDLEGIKIADLVEDEKSFEESITSSLLRIKELDPRRFITVKKEIRWLMNSNQVPKYGGQYRRRNRVCLLNYSAYSEDDKLVSLFFAGLVVHEATHGLLDSKGFRYTKENRVQIERICTAEENRFYKRAENVYPEYEGMLARDFTPEDWHSDWNTPKWTYVFRTLKRIANG